MNMPHRFDACMRWLESPPTRRSLLLMTLTTWLHHGAVWWYCTWRRAVGAPEFFNNLDAGHYTRIVEQGYQWPQWAFFPLYPLAVQAIGMIGSLPPWAAGTLLSSLLFGACVIWWSKQAGRRNASTASLLPATNLGWWLFAASPASWVFHSHHTEALFLALSLAAFAFAAAKRWGAATATAGLCALTRNQGVFVALTVGLMAATAAGQGGKAGQAPAWARRIAAFGAVGLASGAIFALFPLYLYLSAGDALLFVKAQGSWSIHVTSVTEFFTTFLLLNRHQAWAVGDFNHYAFFLLTALGGLALRRRHPQMATYVAFSLFVILLQGTFINSLRFGAVLFPALFAAGDFIARRWPRWAACLLLVFLAYLMHHTVRSYGVQTWAY